MTAAPQRFCDALSNLPEGSTTGHYAGQRYIASKSTFNEGKSVKLVAEELRGTDYISLNLYRLQNGPRVYPCEMPVQEVIDFVVEFTPDID